MPYLNRFEYDIFLSHGWSNNINERLGDRRWVQDLKTRLEVELSARRTPVSICLDVATPRNGDTEERFRNYIRESAIFLAVVTPGFCLEQSFCRKELDWFYDAGRPISARPIGTDKRIFKIESRPVSRDDQPEKIRNLSPYSFYEGNPTPPGLQDYNLLDVSTINTDPALRISIEFNRLVIALVTFFSMWKQDQANYPVRRVFFAASTCPEKAQVLQGIGMHEVVSYPEPGPESPQLTEAELVAKTNQMLASSDCSIHLIDTSGTLVAPAHWQRTIVENQLLCAQRVQNQDFEAFVWCDGERIIGDPYLKELMVRVRNEFPNTGPIKYIPQGIQYFTSNLPALLVPDSRPDIPVPAHRLGKHIFVQFEQNDYEKLEPVFQKLNSLGITVRVPAFEGRRAAINKLRDRFLAETDGTLIYWGSGADASTYLLCDRAVEVYGTDLDNKKRIIGIDPPNDVRRRRFTHPSFLTMPFPADPERLTEQQLRNAFL